MLSIAEFVLAYNEIGKKKTQSGLRFVCGGNAGLAKLVSGAVFPVGLVMVIISGAELFTGNCLLIMPCCEGTVKPGGMLKNPCCVYLGNIAGGMGPGLILYLSHRKLA